MLSTQYRSFLIASELLLHGCTPQNCSDIRQEQEVVDSSSGRPVVYQITPKVSIRETYLNQNTSLISWSEGSYTNIDSFEYGGQFHFSELPVDTFDTDFIYLQQGCGQTCHLLTLLPLVKGSRKKKFFFAEACDIRSKIVAYIPKANPENWIGIVIEKYAQGDKRDLIIKKRFPSVAAECVRKCHFADGRFYIDYDGEGNVRRQRSYDVDSLFGR